MGVIVAIDYGLKRTGLAVTDESKIFAFGLTAIATQEVFSYLKDYASKNNIEKIIIGLPLDLKGKLNDIETEIQVFIQKWQDQYPALPVERIDERFTSKMAEMSMVQTVSKKSDRQNKFLVDEISATLILQTYLEKKIV